MSTETILAIAVMVLISALLAWVLAGVLGGTRIEREDSAEKLRLSFITYTFGTALLATIGIWLACLSIVLQIT